MEHYNRACNARLVRILDLLKKRGNLHRGPDNDLFLKITLDSVEYKKYTFSDLKSSLKEMFVQEELLPFIHLNLWQRFNTIYDFYPLEIKLRQIVEVPYGNFIICDKSYLQMNHYDLDSNAQLTLTKQTSLTATYQGVQHYDIEYPEILSLVGRWQAYALEKYGKCSYKNEMKNIIIGLQDIIEFITHLPAVIIQEIFTFVQITQIVKKTNIIWGENLEKECREDYNIFI